MCKSMCMTVSVYRQCYEIFNLCVEIFCYFTSTNGGLWVLVMREDIPLDFLPSKTHSCQQQSFSRPENLYLPSFNLFFHCKGGCSYSWNTTWLFSEKRQVCVRGLGNGMCSERGVIHIFVGLTQGLSAGPWVFKQGTS